MHAFEPFWKTLAWAATAGAPTLAVLLGAALSPCAHPPPEPPLPRPRPYAAACEAACRSAATLQCPHWDGSPGYDGVRGTADDAPCVTVCEDLEAASHELPAVSLHPLCVARAKSCAEVDACFD